MNEGNYILTWNSGITGFYKERGPLIMPSEIILTMVSSVFGGIIGAMINHFLTRKRTDAEIQKLLAETEKSKAETEILRAEIRNISLSPKIAEIEESSKLVAVTNQSHSSLLDHPQANAPVSTEFINTNATSISVEYREHPSPDEIIEQLTQAPLYQRNSITQSFVGIKVRWHTKLIQFIGSLENKNGEVTILLFGEMTGITCDVEINKYPELKIIKHGHGIWVMGEILGIAESNIISLSKCIIKIEE